MSNNNIAKTAILVSGGGTNLQAIIDAKKNGKNKRNRTPDYEVLRHRLRKKILNLCFSRKAIMTDRETVSEWR